MTDSKIGAVPAIGFATIHPDFISSYFQFGVFAAAQKKRQIQLFVENLRAFAQDKHGSVDDAPYGGGDGMVMIAPVLERCLNSLKKKTGSSTPKVILPCPKGTPLSQPVVDNLATSESPLIFICGRFGGVDERFVEQYVTDRISLGDFVISGGELSSLVIADSVLRMVPGVLGNFESAERDSFSQSNEGLLEHPIYTRPPDFNGRQVPTVLLSGDHKKIEIWKKEKSKEETLKFRPDLLNLKEKENE